MTNKHIWNLEQSIRAQIGLQPKNCWCSARILNAGYGCEPGQTFRCNICDREMPYCRGAADDMDDACDNSCHMPTIKQGWRKKHMQISNAISFLLGAIALTYGTFSLFTIAPVNTPDYPPINQKDCFRDGGTIIYSKDIYPVAIACKR
ncbi:MAG: hypothetical protein ACRCZS_07035 [Chroococcidiopsis sp.]